MPELPTPEQIGLLEVLARQMVELLEMLHRTMQLGAALEELQCSNSMLAEFAGRVSHDLRSPLTTILGYVELGEDDSQVPPGHPSGEYLTLIRNGGERMLTTLENVLDYSRAGGTLNPERVSLLTVTAEAAQDVAWTWGWAAESCARMRNSSPTGGSFAPWCRTSWPTR